jgi:hypothetical protein
VEVERAEACAQVLLARDLLVYEQRRSARSAGHVDKCSAPKAAADLPEVQHMTKQRSQLQQEADKIDCELFRLISRVEYLYDTHKRQSSLRDGERFWVFRFGRVGKRILDAIHVLRFGFMPS